MGITKLSNVPELTEFAGTEKIYVNDNGKTKQIACDKVVTASNGGSSSNRIIANANNYYPTNEEWVTMIENGDDVWMVESGDLVKILSFDWSSSCGGGLYLKASYILDTTVKQKTLELIFDDALKSRLNAIKS